MRAIFIVTVAGESSVRRMFARSRNPSPFGEIVVSRSLSPANGTEPDEAKMSVIRGAAESIVIGTRARVSSPATSRTV